MLKNTIIMLVGMLFACTSGYAEDKIKHLPIKPVPTIENSDKTKLRDIKHDIAEIEATGMVDGIPDDGIVLNDKFFSFSQETQIYGSNGEKLKIGDIMKGSIVGWLLNENGEIVKLWILSEG